VERRKACASRRTRAAPCKCGAKTCAFRRSASFSFFRSFLASLAFVPRLDRDGSGPPLPGSSDKGRVSGEVFGTGVLITRVRIKKRIARRQALACCPHPEVLAQRASKDAGPGASASPFEGRFAATSG
jgi:hypothetical protein